jgi:hypothetical protein
MALLFEELAPRMENTDDLNEIIADSSGVE